MPNRTYANEWLSKACHNFKAAKFLFENSFYEDVIGVEIHNALEKLFKAVIAYKNQKIAKTHDLLALYSFIQQEVGTVELSLLERANSYFKEGRYPYIGYDLPKKEELEAILHMSEKLFEKVCHDLELDCKDCL